MANNEKVDNKNRGIKKLATGLAISATGIAFYNFALPIGMVLAFSGLLLNTSGKMVQIFSQNDSQINKSSNKLRSVGVKLMGSGFVCATSPISGALYATEGGYSLYTNKKSKIIEKISDFIFNVVSGTEIEKNILSTETNKIIRDEKKSDQAEISDIPEVIKKKALKLASEANKLGLKRTNINNTTPKIVRNEGMERK